jgi:hypothetical protein
VEKVSSSSSSCRGGGGGGGHELEKRVKGKGGRALWKGEYDDDDDDDFCFWRLLPSFPFLSFPFLLVAELKTKKLE